MRARWFACGLWVAMAGVITLAGCRGNAREAARSPEREEAAPAPASMDAAAEALEAAGPASEVGQPEPVKTYRPDEMYQAIDGEADLFRAYDCRGLAVARYPAGEATVEAEAFDQGEPLNAFGAYSQLRGQATAPAAIGAAGVALGEDGVVFWKSHYVVRVSVTSSERAPEGVVARLARGIADGLKGSSRLPAWTRALPAPKGEGESLGYAARNALGHGFLSHAMIGEYRVGGRRCRVAVARAADEAEARSWRQRLAAFYHGAAEAGSAGFLGSDYQKRPVRGARSGRYVVLVMGECDAAEGRRLLRETAGRLREVGG